MPCSSDSIRPSAGSTNTMKSSTRSTATDEPRARQDGFARRIQSGFTPAEQEVVFLAVSQTNGCTYCMAAHSMLADKKSGVPKDVLQAIRAGQPIPDSKLASLYALA
ncbi:MAG: carboxymuconolactone decarboxylase family protein, partial [Burkholderiales bacterium]|nr:carboxymuconolactone decarboxylase family protein [Burkholderiales bacterium]